MNWIFGAFFFATMALYVIYARREGSYLNSITGFTLLKCVTEFVLEPLVYNLNIFEYNTSTYFQIYFATFVAYAALVLGALRSRKSITCGRPRDIVPAPMPWLLLAAAFVLYLPIFIEFKDSLLDPRYIYEQTRTGYGIQFFGSALLTNCALILFLLSKRRYHFLFIILLIGFTLSKGSKGQVLTDILIYVVWSIYVLGKRFGIRKTLFASIGLSVFLSAVFVLNFRGEIDSLPLTIASYSDYNRNAALIIEDRNAPLYYGRLCFEDFVFSKIPRVLWENKPKDFGSFLLAENYFPQLFAMDQGAPSFGIGVYFADFGSMAYLVIFLIYFSSGRLLRYFIRLCERDRSVFSFVMTLFCAGVTLLPVGVGYFLLEHLALAWLLQRVVSFLNRKGASSFGFETTVEKAA